MPTTTNTDTTNPRTKPNTDIATTDVYRPQPTEVVYSTLLDDSPIITQSAQLTEDTRLPTDTATAIKKPQVVFDTATLNPPSPTLEELTLTKTKTVSPSSPTLVKTPKSESLTDKNILATSHQLLPTDDRLADDSNAMGRMIEHLNVATKQWEFSVNWQRTPIPKAGFINQWKKKTELLDLDLSCLLCNRYGEVLERVWFKNMRDHAESVRHHGDELLGTATIEADNSTTTDELTVLVPSRLSNDRHMNQERISVYFSRLPPHIFHVVWVLSSFQNHPLATAKQGVCQLMDDEGNVVTEFSLATLADDCRTVRVATLTRASDSWRYHADMAPLDVHGMPAIEQAISDALVRTAK